MDWSVGASAWRLEVSLSEADGVTTLVFVQHLGPEDDASDIGPGWEYYLDRLAAVRDGESFAGWDEYYPAQKDHYTAAAG